MRLVLRALAASWNVSGVSTMSGTRWRSEWAQRSSLGVFGGCLHAFSWREVFQCCHLFSALPDEAGNSTEKAYTEWPGRLYAIDSEGVVRFKSEAEPSCFYPEDFNNVSMITFHLTAISISVIL